MTDQLLLQRLDRKWGYTLSEAARAEVGFDPIETYIRKSQNTVAHYIAVIFLLNLCEAAERNEGAGVGMRW